MQKIWKGEQIQEERQEKKKKPLFLWKVMAKFPDSKKPQKKAKKIAARTP